MTSSRLVVALCGLAGVVAGLLALRFVLQDPQTLAQRSTRSGALRAYALALFASAVIGVATAEAVWMASLLVDLALVDAVGALKVTAGTLAILYLLVSLQTFRTYAGRQGRGLRAIGGALLLAAFWLPIGVAIWFWSRPPPRDR